MIVYSLLLITILLALVSLRLVWRSNIGAAAERILKIITALLLALFIFLYGAWVFLSVYVKYLFAALFIVTFVCSCFKKKIDKPGKRIAQYIRLVRIFLLSTLCTLYFTGTIFRPYGTVELSLPFKRGTYFVFQGGKGLPTNLFHYGFRGAVFAMDLIKLNRYGNRATSIFSKNLTDYATYGDTIYSPCNGVIQSAKDENGDNIPPAHERGPSNTNHVLIAADKYYVFMGHMKYKSVFVHEGDTVVTGQPLGLAGNSGFSLEPHLHIQVHERTNGNIPWYKEKPLYIKFDGKGYLLFEEIMAN